jgi:hypothetical protein
MSAGRCEGCGATGSACKVKEHTLECGEWLAAFRRDPRSPLLDPEASASAYADRDREPEREARRDTAMADNESRRAAQRDRFRRRNILEET